MKNIARTGAQIITMIAPFKIKYIVVIYGIMWIPSPVPVVDHLCVTLIFRKIEHIVMNKGIGGIPTNFKRELRTSISVHQAISFKNIVPNNSSVVKPSPVGRPPGYQHPKVIVMKIRSEERRVGKECRARW